MDKNYYVFLALLWVCLPGFSQILFTESSAAQNITVSHGNVLFASGVSFFDFDNDGWDDLTFASEAGAPIYFYKNNSGTFSAYNVSLNDYQNDTRQINWVDIDNDGDNDLFVTSNDASNKLYLNNGGMNMTDITASSGIPTSVMYSWGSSWGDYNNDSYLDLFLSNYDIDNGLQQNRLYRNNGNNTFTDVSNAAGIDILNHFTFCSAFFDYNNDGWQDIYMANDRTTTTNILYKNNGNGTFTDVSALSGTDLAINAMSTTIDDADYDGWLDIYVTNTTPGNYFLENNGNGTFTDIAAGNGTLFASIAWGAVFLDADNDTDQDLYVSGSGDGSGGFLPSAFYENLGNGSFSIPSGAGFASDVAVSYSNAIGDVNNDGYPDITVGNKEPTPNFLWVNDCHTNTNNNWLKVNLEGTVSNRMGIGSWIEIQVNGLKQYRYTLCGEGYISQNSGTEFFGLKNATTVDYVKVTWLSGIVDILYNVSANQTINIVENSTLSVEDYEPGNEVLLYPNPSNGKFHIELNSGAGDFELEVFDLLGKRIVPKKQYQSGSPIELKLLKRGIYLLKIQSSRGTINKKIVID